MNGSTIDTLVRMANQIAANLGHEPEPASAVAEHIRLFWDPRMKQAIFAHIDAGGAGLTPSAHIALQSLQDEAGVIGDRPSHEQEVGHSDAG